MAVIVRKWPQMTVIVVNVALAPLRPLRQAPFDKLRVQQVLQYYMTTNG